MTLRQHPQAHATTLLSVLLLTGLTTGCTLKATLDSVSDSLSNFFSSTSGRSWLTEDGLVRDDAKAQAFVVSNWSNLSQDIAKADGEYLGSFEHLLAVPGAHRDSFRRVAQTHLTLLTTDWADLARFTEVMSASAEHLRPASATIRTAAVR